MKPLNVVIIGTGMYTCGRGTEGYGTIAPALFEWAKKNDLGKVYIAGTDPKGVAAARNKIEKLSLAMDVDINLEFFPAGRHKDARSYRKALALMPHPACAIVAVPDHMHRKVAGDAIGAGLHTMVVKPLVPTLGEAHELIDLSEKKGVYCAVEFHKRFDEANLVLKDVISSSRIGDPLYFVVEYSQRKSIPSKRFSRWAKETNVFQYLGIHYVDIIYFATGATPLRAMAMGRKEWLRARGVDTYDSVCGVVEWRMPSGKRFTSHILTNWIDPEATSAMSDQKIKVVGTKGRFESDQKQRGITIVTDDKGVEEPNPYFCAPYGPEGATSYRGYGIDSICQFLDDAMGVENGEVAVADLERKRPTFRQSIVPTAVLEAVNKSLKMDGAWIRIKA